MADGQVGFQLQGGKDHGQRLAAALSVPDQPPLLPTLDHPLDNFIHRPVLLVTADLFDDLVVFPLKDHKMGQQIEQSLRFQQAV